MDYGADFEQWRRQQEAAQAAAMEQQRIQAEQQRAAQAAAAQAQAVAQAQAEQMRRAQEQAQAQQIAQMQQAQQIPTLQAQSMPGMTAQQTQPTPNYADQAKDIGLPWSPNDADYVQQINDYNARLNKIQQTAAERQATTEALRQQIAANPALLEQGKQNLANDRQLNTLADQLNAFYAKQNNTVQDEAQKAYTTAVLRTQIAQNPELFANALKQFAPKASGKKRKQAQSQAAPTTETRGEYYSPSYVTESGSNLPADIGGMDNASLNAYYQNVLGKKKIM